MNNPLQSDCAFRAMPPLVAGTGQSRGIASLFITNI